MKKFLFVALCISLCLCLTACESEDSYLNVYEDGYYDASVEFSEHSHEMYEEGYKEAYRDFSEGIIWYEAIHYARQFSEWSPEEAMCVIDAYESGTLYYGSLPITEQDYKEAVESLYHYYEYFYNAMYKQDAECDYDNYESKP